MKRVSDRMLASIYAIIDSKNSDEIAYAYYRLTKFVYDSDLRDAVTRYGERYLDEVAKIIK